ncbi:MAG TPA: trigger factor [Phycisphaerales bacterium]|nr:trigger factor [Phycisphaerales bacterium]HRQ75072.1 trigger factor [Phycisphaerales bacterium]
MAEATATKEKTASNITIEDTGPARKRLTITIPADAIAEKLELSLTTLATETVLPGFRKGRAPRALLQKRFGTAVRDETRNQLIADAYAQAIEEKGLKPVGDPDPVTPMDEIKLEDGKALTFAVDVEVVPEFDLPALDGFEIKKPMLQITEEHIKSEMDRQCLNFGTPHKIEGNFQAGDRLGGYAAATRAGEDKPFFTHDEVGVIYPVKEDEGRGLVLGLLIDDLESKLKGTSVGDTVEVTTTVPENHEREDIRGKEITISFQIRQAHRVEPATPQAVAENYGLGTEENLREQIKIALEQRLLQEQAEAMRSQVYEQLIDAVDFELPEKLSASQAARTLKQYEVELLYRGLSPEEVEKRLAEAREESEVVAQRRLKLFFVMHRLAETFKIEVSEQEVNGRIALIAAQRNVRPEQLRNELMQAGRLPEVAMQVRDHKSADRIIAQSKVTEISTAEWQKIVAEKQAARRAGKGEGEATTKKKSSSKKTTKKSS